MAGVYDLLIIGAGSAGLTAAGFARQLGVRVALVEKGRVGGDCTWTGCVPSKTLLKVAKVAQQMRTADRFGLHPSEPAVDLGRVMAHVREVVEAIYAEESPAALEADGIEVIQGAARFLDPHTLRVGERTVSARRLLIATGAGPALPPIPGLAEIKPQTYETVWRLATLPRRLLVLGGGPVGCELGQAFRRLGSEVVLVDGAERLLPREEPEASRVVEEVLRAEGVEVLVGAQVVKAWCDAVGVHLPAGEQTVTGDVLLVATGRRANLARLDLEKAGVAYTAEGISVDGYLQTSQSHIYAAGDCTGGPQFTHYAAWQAFMATRNALLPGRAAGVSTNVPWATFTDPEVAHVGLSEAEARRRHGEDVATCDWPLAKVDRARTDGNVVGFVKLVHRKDGRLLGATMASERAGEAIQEWVVAIERGLKVGDLANVIHIYPTYATANMQAAAAIRVQQLLSGTSGAVIRGLSRLVR